MLPFTRYRSALAGVLGTALSLGASQETAHNLVEQDSLASVAVALHQVKYRQVPQAAAAQQELAALGGAVVVVEGCRAAAPLRLLSQVATVALEPLAAAAAQVVQ
jgi:hypothetical protein